MRRNTLSITTTVIVVGLVLLQGAVAHSKHGIIDVVNALGYSDANPESLFNKNESDFNILSTLLLLANVDSVFSFQNGFTLFAPNDAAFTQTAKDLGVRGGSEKEVFENLFLFISQTFEDPVPALQNFLILHLIPEKLRFPLSARSDVEAKKFDNAIGLQGIHRNNLTLIDKNPYFPDPKVILGLVNLDALNGYIHVVDRALLMESLQPYASPESKEEDSFFTPTPFPSEEIGEDEETFPTTAATSGVTSTSQMDETSTSSGGLEIDMQANPPGPLTVNDMQPSYEEEFIEADAPLEFDEILASDMPEPTTSEDVATIPNPALPPTITASSRPAGVSIIPETVATSPEITSSSQPSSSASPGIATTSAVSTTTASPVNPSIIPTAEAVSAEDLPSSSPTTSISSTVAVTLETVSTNPEFVPDGSMTLSPTPEFVSGSLATLSEEDSLVSASQEAEYSSAETNASMSVGTPLPSFSQLQLSPNHGGTGQENAEQLPTALDEPSSDYDSVSNTLEETTEVMQSSPDSSGEDIFQSDGEESSLQGEDDQETTYPMPSISASLMDELVVTATPAPPVVLPPITPTSYDHPTSSGGPLEWIDVPSSTEENEWEVNTSMEPYFEGRACFASSQLVHLDNGTDIYLSSLGAGHIVRTTESEFSQVYLFTHRKPRGTFDFVRIVTEDKHEITMTKGHYLYANGKIEAAGRVLVGDMLRSLDGPTRVQSVRMVRDHGLIAPHTLHGDIVINRIVASTYTTAVNPTVAHVMLWPVRAVTRLGLTNEPLGRVLYDGIQGIFAKYRRRACHLRNVDCSA